MFNAGVGTGGTGSVAKTITGKVADGYLEKATVFIDKNGNYQLDDGEPSTVTDSGGVYTLIVGQADVGTSPIVALAIKGVTIDKDTNQAVDGSFLLSMPKESVSSTAVNNFISPISTQLREMLETGLYTSVQNATDSLSAQMGLPAGTDILADYIATDNNDIRTAAQNIATIMGKQAEYVVEPGGATTSIDVDRYRGMIGIIFSNMSTVKAGSFRSDTSNLSEVITRVLANMPSTGSGKPFQNMSAAFRNKTKIDKH